MTTRKLPESLASIATSAHIVSILKEGRPVEPRLEHLHRCLLQSEMTSTGIFVAVIENPLLLFFRYTPSNDLVCTVFEHKWLLPIIGINFGEEVFLILCLPFSWDLPCR